MTSSLCCVAVAVTLFKFSSQQSDVTCDVPADVGFVLDGSESVTEMDWEREKDFVANFVNNLEIGRDSIHIGTVVYSTIVGNVVNIAPYKPKEILMGMAKNLKQLKMGSDTAKGIENMHRMLRDHGRKDAQKVMIIITDEKSLSPTKTIQQALLTKQEGINIIVIGVGSRVFKDELRQIATSRRTLFTVADFMSLQRIIVTLKDLVCQRNLF